MARELPGKAYGEWLVWHIVAMIAVTFGIPVTIFAAGCVWSGDWSVPDHDEIVETLRLTTGTGLAAIAYIISIVVFVWPTWRRMATLKLPACASLIVFFLLLIDTPFFFSSRETQIFGFSASSLWRFPFFVLSALSISIAITLADPPTREQRPFRRFGYAGIVGVTMIAIIIGGVFLLIAAMKGIDVIEYRVKHEQDFSQTLMKFIVSVYWLFWLWPIACLLLMISLARCVVISRRERLN